MNDFKRYRAIAGSSILLLLIISAWFGRDLFITAFIFPLILGALQFIDIIRSVPQIIWWIFVIITSFSLILIKTSMPTLHLAGRKEREGDSRLFELDKLIGDSLGSAKYTGQQLTHLIVNLHLKNIGEKEITIGEVETMIKRGTLPEEIQELAIPFYRNERKRKKRTIERSTLEKAVKYLNTTIIGDHINERSPK